MKLSSLPYPTYEHLKTVCSFDLGLLKDKNEDKNANLKEHSSARNQFVSIMTANISALLTKNSGNSKVK